MKWFSRQKDQAIRYRYNVYADRWERCPDEDDDSMNHCLSENKKKSWVISAIPWWILAICVFLFLVWERHLVVNYDGRAYIDISYQLLSREPDDITVYDQRGEKSIRLAKNNDFGIKHSIWNLSGGGTDTYTRFVYDGGLLAARIDQYGSLKTRIIYYSSDGLIIRMQETVNGSTQIYSFSQELCDDPEGVPERMVDYIHGSS